MERQFKEWVTDAEMETFLTKLTRLQDKATEQLLSASDPTEMYRLQGQETGIRSVIALIRTNQREARSKPNG